MNKDNIKELFLELVKINSPSGKEDEIARYLSKKLSLIGASVFMDSYGNVIAKFNCEGEPLLISAHMDTLASGIGIKPIIDGDIIKSSEGKILGADDKAGIAEILFALMFLKKKNIKHCPLEIVFTKEEETGLIGAKNLEYDFLEAKKGLVLDRSGKKEVIVTASPFVMLINILIEGKSAHASVPEKGINAIDIAIEALYKIKKGRIDEETTSNIGVIKGGDVVNAVAKYVEIKIEVRSHEKSKMMNIASEYEKIFNNVAKKRNAKCFFNKNVGCCGYKLDKKDPFLMEIEKAWKNLGIDPIFEKAGGASDANEFVRNGIKAVDISYGGKNAHTSEEEINVNDMLDISKFLIEFVSIK